MHERRTKPLRAPASEMRLAVLQHEDETGPGMFARLLASTGVHYDLLDTRESRLPPPAAFHGAVVLGGSSAAHDPRMHTALEWVREALLRDTPLLGICLGSQLLALALGASVRRLRRPEAGIHQIVIRETARHDPLFGGLPRRLCVFGWHEDAFEPPPGAVPLAVSESAPQAFRWSSTAYGLQFHPEVRANGLRRWRAVAGYRDLLARSGGDWCSMARSLERATPQLDALARHLLERWLGLVAQGSDRCRTVAAGDVDEPPAFARCAGDGRDPEIAR
jgi:GMP synthase (glutamine-hydrolysing)